MLDANNLPDQQRLTTQLCIVGAGAAGIAMAMEFIGSGIQVLVLEAASFDPAAEAAATPDTAADRLRSARRPDGATSAASGSGSRRGVRCRPLSAPELAARSHVADSGWPIEADALAGCYERALGLCESGVSAFSARHDAITMSQPLIAGLGGEPFGSGLLDQYAPLDPMARRYRRRLAAAGNICVIGNAQVTGLHLDPSGHNIERLSVQTSGQRRLQVSAQTVVLAAGSEATARLLLLGRDAQGIGNAHGNVGRYCMSPLRGTIGIVRLYQAPAAIWHGPRNRQRSRRPLMLGSEAQRQFRLPAFAMRLRPIPADDLITAALARFGRGSGFAHRFQIGRASCRERVSSPV